MSVSNVSELAAGIRSGDRRALAQGITLAESQRKEDLAPAQQLLQEAGTGAAMRIGITGVPGVGKSTFIDTFGSMLTAKGHKVAVLAVDPSSALSGGSILGDKTRMETLSRDPNAFIRPSPGGDSLGGIAHRSRDVMLLCEAAGFDVILVETIGVGQSEVAVADMVDTFVLLMLSGAGDELQGIKRGVMELADLVVVHKADGDNERPAQLTAREFAGAMQLLPNRHAAWTPVALTASSQTGAGLDAVLEQILAHRAALGDQGIAALRREQSVTWFGESLKELAVRRFLEDVDVQAARAKVRSGELSVAAALQSLLR